MSFGQMKKNIVIICTMYYPEMDAPSSVINKIIREISHEYNFYVITKTNKLPSEYKRKNNIFYIESIRHKIQRRCYSNLRQKRNVFLSQGIITIIGLYKLFLTQFRHPNANAWESKAYYRQLTVLSKQIQIYAIIGVSSEVFCQYGIKKFKEREKNIKWIQFITDPFTENYIYYRYKLFPQKWEKWNLRDEKSFYELCDGAMLTPEMYTRTIVKFPEYASKCKKMHFALQDFSALWKPNKSNSRQVRLIYAGAVYKDIRNPEVMMKTCSSIPDIHLDMYTNLGDSRGECDAILNQYKSDNIRVLPYVPKDQYLDMICNEYDVLVNIGNISDLQAPSKMLDLLSTGRPILNFYFIKDAQYHMIERYPLGMNVHCDDCYDVKLIRRFCYDMRGKRLPFEEVKKLYPEHCIEQQVRIFIDLLSN